ncbi:MAG: NB-ARC domain-containing protein [Chloroflexota bacterium]
MCNPPLLNVNQTAESVRAALRAWRTINSTKDDLLAFLLLVQERRRVVTRDSNPSTLRLATNQVLLDGLDELASKDEMAARVLRARFLDDQKALTVAHHVNLSQDQVFRVQRQAIEHLTHILLEREQGLRQERIQQLEAHLQAPTYGRLFGVAQAQRALVETMLKPEAAELVAIIGIGGIGKTSLADAVTRCVIRHFTFDQVVWLRIETRTMSGISPGPNVTFQALLAALAEQLWPAADSPANLPDLLWRVRRELKARPHLVVIDNLEAEADTLYLLDHLRDLAGPSKFLLTTRTRPPATANAFTLSLDELEADDAAGLLRHYASEIGVKDLAQATPTEADSIYQVTGGNPLALKLVVSLAAVLPLPQILQDLTRGRPGPVGELYTRIYRRAWQILTPSARRLLQIMPLAAESGAGTEQMQAISHLSGDSFWSAVSELVARSLLEVRGTTWERRYGIHRLTETFLRTEILDWPE